MPDREYIDVEIRSNIEALSSARLHQSLMEMVQRSVEASTAFLKTIEPKDTGALIEHTDHTDVIEDLTGLIEAKIGIKPIGDEHVPGAGGLTQSPRFSFQPSDTSRYPIFVDTGTGVFGPTGTPIFARSGHSMHFEIDGYEFFALSVLGQPGQHFMAATEAFAETLVREDQHIRLALTEMAAEAAALLPETLR